MSDKRRRKDEPSAPLPDAWRYSKDAWVRMFGEPCVCPPGRVRIVIDIYPGKCGLCGRRIRDKSMGGEG